MLQLKNKKKKKKKKNKTKQKKNNFIYVALKWYPILTLLNAGIVLRTKAFTNR